MLSSEPIFRIHADLGEIMELGATPYGGRRLIPILGGRVKGPKLRGRILPGGADWQIILANGVTDIQTRYSIESDTGARVIVTATGCVTVRARCWRQSGAARRSMRAAIISGPSCASRPVIRR